MVTYLGKDILARTDSDIREMLNGKVVHIDMDSKPYCTGEVVNFFQAESNVPNRCIVGLILNNVEVCLSDNMEITVQS